MIENRVTLHVPQGDGSFLQIRKFEAPFVRHLTTDDHNEIFVERSAGDYFLTRATVDGDVVYRVPLGQTPFPFLTAGSRPDRAYLANTSEEVMAFDPGSGRLTGTLHCSGAQDLVSLPNGTIAMVDERSVVITDADLSPITRTSYPWEVDSYQSLEGGASLATSRGDFYHLGHIQIRAADDRVTFSSEQVRPTAYATLPNGRVQLLEYDAAKHQTSLVTVDPQVGEVGRALTGAVGRGVFPLSNGTSIVYTRNEDSTCAFILHASDGSVLRSHAFQPPQIPQELFTDDARDLAYVRIGSDRETIVLKLDLTPVPGEREPVEMARANGALVASPVFEDGKIAIAGRDGVRVFGPEGVVTYPTLRAFKDAVGDPPLQSARLLGYEPRVDGGTMSQWRRLMASHIPFPDRLDFISGNGSRIAVPGSPESSADHCLNFAREVDGPTAMRDMKLPDESVYARMVMSRQARAVGEISFPDGVGTVTASPRTVRVNRPGQREFNVEGFDNVQGVLPLKAGDECFLAFHERSVQDNRLHWCHPASNTWTSFDVTQPVSALYAGEAVYAVGVYGAVLMVEPSLPPDQRLESNAPLPAPQPATGGVSGERIVTTEKTVSIGGLVLPRRSSD